MVKRIDYGCGDGNAGKPEKKIDIADIHTLELMEDLLQFGERDPLLTMAAEQEASFLRGIKDADEGSTTPHEAVMKKYNEWLTK